MRCACMRRDRSFSAVADLTLALGIGANTAIFSVVNAVLLKPLPYAEADRLVLVVGAQPAIGKERDPVAPLNLSGLAEQNTVFEDLGAFRFGSFALDNAGDPEQLSALSMTSSVFRVLASTPALAACSPRKKSAAAISVVVLAHDVWQRRFGGDLPSIGRWISLDGAAFTVVGVMPPGFHVPGWRRRRSLFTDRVHRRRAQQPSSRIR